MLLSICMIVKNEEKNLSRCLKSLTKLTKYINSELIIVDTGSTDDTVDIAKQYTDKVYIHTWNNDFAAMRNISIAYSKGDWILIIDADEEVENAAGLIEFLNSTAINSYTTGVIRLKNVLVDGEKTLFGYAIIPRLFKKEADFKFSGAIHEQPMVKKMIHLETTFLHYGYSSTDKKLMEMKFQRNSSLLKSEVSRNPENIYDRYQLSVTYQMHGDAREALDEALAAFNLVKEKGLDPRNYLYVYNQLLMCYMDMGFNEKAEAIGLGIVRLEPESMDVHFLLAKLLASRSCFQEAENHYLIYLKLVRNFDKLAYKHDLTAKFLTLSKKEEAFLGLSNLYYERGKYSQALEYLERVKNSIYQTDVFKLMIKILTESKAYVKLVKYFEKEVLTFSKEKVTLFLTFLETHKKTMDKEEVLKIVELFSWGKSDYAKYNKILLSYALKDPSLESQLQTLKLDSDPDVYSDLLFFRIIYKMPITEELTRLSQNKVYQWVLALEGRYENFKTELEKYLMVYQGDNSLSSIRSLKLLSHYLLCSGVSEENFSVIFKEYIKNGVEYIRRIYSSEFIKQELINDLKNDEEIFLIHICRAIDHQENDHDYLKYLSKALKSYPIMHKGIDLLLDENKVKLEVQKENKNEFEQLKLKFKLNIQTLINSGHLVEAKNLIKEYESIMGADSEILQLVQLLESKQLG